MRSNGTDFLTLPGSKGVWDKRLLLDFLWWKGRKVKGVSWFCSIFFSGKGKRKGSIHSMQKRVQDIFLVWYLKNKCETLEPRNLPLSGHVRRANDRRKTLSHIAEVDLTRLESLLTLNVSLAVLFKNLVFHLLSFIPRNCHSNTKFCTSDFLDLSKVL